MDAHELARQMFSAKKAIDEALRTYEQAIREDADADDVARRQKARAYLTCREQLGGKATVGAIEAAVDLETSEVQMQARLAEGLKRSAAQALEGKRTWLMALMSLASLSKAEAQIAAYEPSEVRTA